MNIRITLHRATRLFLPARGKNLREAPLDLYSKIGVT